MIKIILIQQAEDYIKTKLLYSPLGMAIGGCAVLARAGMNSAGGGGALGYFGSKHKTNFYMGSLDLYDAILNP